MSTNEPKPDEWLAEARSALNEDMSQWGGEYGLELIAEVKRLRALTTVTEDMVERGARAFYDYPIPGASQGPRLEWGHLVKVSPGIADSYRAVARATLDAVLAPKETK